EATAGPVADVSPHGVSGRQRLFCWGPDGLSGRGWARLSDQGEAQRIG
ncbi:MAG: hypothetical protein, partial [Olavius algarvensis Gamma 1 endosymbiont]